MAKTEYQVRIEILETRAGEPLKQGNKFNRVYWIVAEDVDLPIDVVHAAKNLVSSNTDWDK